MTKTVDNQGMVKSEGMKMEGNMHVTEVGAFQGMRFVAGSLARYK